MFHGCKSYVVVSVSRIIKYVTSHEVSFQNIKGQPGGMGVTAKGCRGRGAGGPWRPSFMEIVRFSEILMFRRKIFGLLLLFTIKASNFMGKLGLLLCRYHDASMTATPKYVRSSLGLTAMNLHETLIKPHLVLFIPLGKNYQTWLMLYMARKISNKLNM